MRVCVQVAQSVMGGSVATALTEHPIDSKYRQLNANLSVLAKSDPTYAALELYTRNTMGYQKITLQHIWAVNRGNEDTSFNAYSHLSNHRLLWHGTNIAVVAAILKTGLRIMPTVNGGRVGRGIYLANELGKSSGYVRSTRLADGTNLGVLFLVEAALGNMNVIFRDDGSLRAAPAGFDSVLAKGTQEPDAAHDLNVMIDGKPVVVPQGAVVQNKGVSSSFHQNEVITA